MPHSFTKCCCLNLPATSRIQMCPHFSTATTIISHLSHCNRFLSASTLVASTLVSIRWDPFPRKARACYSFAQEPTMSSNLTLSKSPSFSNSLSEPMCSGTNHPWPVPFPPHTPPTTLALWPLQPLRHASISRFCTCCSLYLERSFPSNQAGLPPHFSKVFAQMSSSEWSFSWSPYYKLQIHTHTYVDILYFLSLAYFSP